MYSEKELQDTLNTKIFGCKIYIYKDIDSTNTLAKKVASLGAAEGTVVLTDYQTAGRGRFGKTWIGEPANNLLLSLIIKPKISNQKMGLIPFFIAVGTAFTIEALTGLKCECKWPNDLLLNKRKCCGILIESSYVGNNPEFVIVGIGINVNQRNFGIELEHKATSLFNECGKKIEIKDVFKQLMRSLESLYIDVSKGFFNLVMKEWKSRTQMFGKEIILLQDNNEISAKAIDLSEDGGLIIETLNGIQTFYSGEVSLKKW